MQGLEDNVIDNLLRRALCSVVIGCFVPSGAGGVVSRFDTQASFTTDTSWSHVEIATMNVSYKGFTGATFDGRYVYMVPGFGTVSARLDTHASFTSPSAWSTVDIASAASTASNFAGAVWDGKYVYYVPWRAGTTGSSIITRYDPQGAFGDVASWSALDLSTLNANAKGFHTGAFDGRYLYLVPGWTAPSPSWSASTLARFDTQASFAASSAWSFYDVGGLGANAGGFNTASFDGRYLVFSPGYSANAYRGTAYRYDTKADLSAADSWSKFDVPSLRSSLLNLKSSAFDGRYMYFAPVGGVAARSRRGVRARCPCSRHFTARRSDRSSRGSPEHPSRQRKALHLPRYGPAHSASAFAAS